MGRSLTVGLVFFAIFVLGMFAGGFLMARWVKHNWMQNRIQQQAGVIPIGPLFARQALNRLDLTPEQRKQVNKILNDDATTLRVLRNLIETTIGQMQVDIDNVLTPEQRTKLGHLREVQRQKLQDQRDKVHHYLQQLRRENNGEAPPEQSQPSVPVPTVSASAQSAPTPPAQ